MAKIEILGMSFYAYHGCFEEERTIGTNFVVDCCLDVDIAKAAQSDSLSETIDYQVVYRIIEQELSFSSHLLENIAYRIIKHIQGAYSSVKEIEVRVGKLNPPLGGEIEKVSVVLSSKEI